MNRIAPAAEIERDARPAPSPAPGAATRPMRLGFPVKLLGRPDLKSNDARRWQSGPHLRVSLEYLDQILDHLDRIDVRMYRMSSDLAPYATHPDMPQFHGMIAECDGDLAAVGAKARALDIRLSFHPSQFVLLNAPDPEIVRKSIADLAAQAGMLDRMGLGPEAVLVTHVGGVYDDRETSRARWAETWDTLPETVRRRLVLENDDIRFSALDTLWIHERTGVRLIFDYQHHWCFNPERSDMVEVFGRVLATWPAGVRPKMHFSSPRTEMRQVERRDRKTGKRVAALLPPIWTGHADFINPFEFARFIRDVKGRDVKGQDGAAHDFDVMLEAKAKDLALLRLRADLPRYAPDVGERFGLTASGAAEGSEEAEDEDV